MSANAYVLKEIFNKLDAIGIHQGLILSKLEKLEGKSQQIEAIQSEKVSKPEILGVSIEDFGKHLQEMNEEKAIEILDELFTKNSKK